jgi:Xaa-Pro aminopeptidase
MVREVSILVFTILLVFSIYSQTPEQTYFDWTQMPFSKEELDFRRNNLIEILIRQGKSGVVLIPARDGFSYGETFRQLDDFYYFTGLELPNSMLALDLVNRKSIVFVPERDLRFENGARQNDFPGRPLLDDSQIEVKSGIELQSIENLPQLLNKTKTVLINNGRQGPVSFASDAYIATYSPVQILLNALQNKHPNLEYENIYGSLASLRMIKSEAEIQMMRNSVNITVKGIKLAAKKIKEGIDERYLEGVIEGSYKINGSHRLAFGSIIKSGPNSLWPWRILATHYNRRNRTMKNGELVIFDVGCEYEHYVSDVGRTFPVSGKFSERQKEILLMETNIADQIIDFLRPGITFNDIRTLTDSIIPDRAKKYMQVGLFFGHHLGLATGDPNLPLATLQPGMIFTVEPWYYNHDESISVFTEDVVLITEEGCEVLSAALPRTPENLEKVMQRED